MRAYGVARTHDDMPYFKNATRKSARRHASIKKDLHRLARRTWKCNRRKWKNTKIIDVSDVGEKEE